MYPGTCVSPSGEFVWGVHIPRFTAINLREGGPIEPLGTLPDGTVKDNRGNFPLDDLVIEDADRVYEIPNPFPFRGATYIAEAWAEAKARNPAAICLPPGPRVSFREFLTQTSGRGPGDLANDFAKLPDALRLALAVTSTDPEDLILLAQIACDLQRDPDTGRPAGLRYVKTADGRIIPDIRDVPLFEAVANNPHLPDAYKRAMVLRPGAQGTSEILGQWGGRGDDGHVYEYFRRNSYIAWGHYAANMADDAVRYRIADLRLADMMGMRHLYYQRTYARLAADLNIALPARGRTLSPDELEQLRRDILARLADHPELPFSGTLWGWNFGFDYAPTHYRLHASHQQVHQQFALVPQTVPAAGPHGSIPAYACGDLVAAFVRDYETQTRTSFFDNYLKAIRGNRRMDDRQDAPADLVVAEAGGMVLFVPKAQTSQWELQLMAPKHVGNILDADPNQRAALDRCILIALRVLESLGARMVTSIEFSRRLDAGDLDQRLLYSFLPRLPQSPGGFSEAQLRFINGHYPEDFAALCRAHLSAAGDLKR